MASIIKQSLLIATLVAGVGLAGIGRADEGFHHPYHPERGDARFAHRHPRRDQVADRLARQHRRIRHEVREGEMTHAQAQALHAQDRNIRAQEQAMTRANGGYITPAQQAQLNAEENQVSGQIRR